MRTARDLRTVALVVMLSTAVVVLGITSISIIRADRTEDQGAAARAASADLAFIERIAFSHQAAIDMSGVARTRGGPEVRRLSTGIARARRAESRRLRSIEKRLGRKGARPGSLGVTTTGLRPDLQELRQVRVFDRAFIEMMVKHHEEAIRLARAELRRGVDEGTREVARVVLRTQTQEIVALNYHRAANFGDAPSVGGP